jgi:ubiquinone/menaquinone biosynthesis C-methylase UbiE
MLGGWLRLAIKRVLPAPAVRELARLHRGAVLLWFRGDVTRAKVKSELAFWRRTLLPGMNVENRHYEHLFTTLFGIKPEEYAGWRVLDIGCGPRGSLEWAVMAGQRIGLDPLADAYRVFGTMQHATTYVKACSEAIPFIAAAFDVVASFNSLDHVDMLTLTLEELERVLAPGGLLLIIVEVNHEPTLTEPIAFSWDILVRFPSSLRVVTERRFEKPVAGIYESIRMGVRFDARDPTLRPGILCAMLRKVQKVQTVEHVSGVEHSSIRVFSGTKYEESSGHLTPQKLSFLTGRWRLRSVSRQTFAMIRLLLCRMGPKPKTSAIG